jgi:ribonucleoside-diphosphate reductase alpha chain
LAIFHLRKKSFKSFTPPPLFEHVRKFTALGIYDKDILDKYSKQEIEELDAYTEHERDMKFSYAAVKQLEGKYLVQNRTNGDIYESPQQLYMLVGLCLFQEYEPKKVRLDIVKRFYDAVSNFKISLPTPIMAGVRTPTRQFSSCVLIEADDDLDSLGISIQFFNFLFAVFI